MKRHILDSSPWIGDGRPLPHGAAWFADFPAPRFRTEFSVTPEAHDAVLQIACAGCFMVEVNGWRLTSASPMPLWSPFDKTIYAERFRLSRRILRSDGKPNEVVITLGNKPFDWGKIDVSVDGRKIACGLDCHGTQSWWKTPALPLFKNEAGRHRVEVVALSEKNAESDGFGCHLTGVLISGGRP